MVAGVLAELGACAEARSLTNESLDCRPEPLPANVALARAAELRQSGRSSDAARLSARVIQTAREAGRHVRAIPLLPRREGGAPLEVTRLEHVLFEHWEVWQHEPAVYFLGGSICVGGSCLLPAGQLVTMPGAELVSGFAPRRFDYPWRMHPARRLTANADAIVDHARVRKVALAVPAGVVPDRFTGMRVADLAFSRDGGVVWALARPGRLFAVDAVSGRLLQDFDVTSTCPRVGEPFHFVSAAGAEVAIAHIGPEPGCATLIRMTESTISALPFAPGEVLALSGNGRVAAVHHEGRITSYDLEARKSLESPVPPSFAVPELNKLALSYDGSVIALVVLGKEVKLPDGALEIWSTPLTLLQPNGRPLPGHEALGIGYGGVLANGDFGARVYSLYNAIFDYRGTLRAVLISRHASVLAAFSDGTLEAMGPAARELYRCAIDGERFPAEDCADAFERRGQLNALVDEPPVVPAQVRGHGQRWASRASARD